MTLPPSKRAQVLGVVVAALGLVAGLAATDPGGWRHQRPAAVAVRSSSGFIVGSHESPAPGAPLVPSHPPWPGAPSDGLQHLPPLPTPSSGLPPVAALSTLRSADAIVTLPSTITPSEVAGLRHLQGLSAVEEVDAGTVNVAGAPAVALGVDPATFRQFTPKVTASPDQLWRYVAGGALVASYDLASARGLPLGRPVAITPAGGNLAPTSGWLGALVSFGLPGVDLLVSHAYSDRLGLVPDSGLIVSSPSLGPAALDSALASTLPGASVELIGSRAGGGTPASPLVHAAP